MEDIGFLKATLREIVSAAWFPFAWAGRLFRLQR